MQKPGRKLEIVDYQKRLKESVEILESSDQILTGSDLRTAILFRLAKKFRFLHHKGILTKKNL
jgi:hypothetical protein